MASVRAVSKRVRRRNQDVIHVNSQPSFSNHIPERIVHESLEGGGGIGKTEEHDGWFKKAFMDDEGCFPLISFFDVDVVVPPTNIKLWEDGGVSDLVNEVRDQGKCYV